MCFCPKALGTLPERNEIPTVTTTHNNERTERVLMRPRPGVHSLSSPSSVALGRGRADMARMIEAGRTDRERRGVI